MVGKWTDFVKSTGGRKENHDKLQTEQDWESEFFGLRWHSKGVVHEKLHRSLLSELIFG
jgi:hypothetical protein